MGLARAAWYVGSVLALLWILCSTLVIGRRASTAMLAIKDPRTPNRHRESAHWISRLLWMAQGLCRPRHEKPFGLERPDTGTPGQSDARAIIRVESTGSPRIETTLTAAAGSDSEPRQVGDEGRMSLLRRLPLVPDTIGSREKTVDSLPSAAQRLPCGLGSRLSSRWRRQSTSAHEKSRQRTLSLAANMDATHRYSKVASKSKPRFDCSGCPRRRIMRRPRSREACPSAQSRERIRISARRSVETSDPWHRSAESRRRTFFATSQTVNAEENAKNLASERVVRPLN